MNFGQIVTAVGNRSSISSTDPWYDRIGPEAVMPAIHEIETYNMAGWDWLWLDMNVSFSTDQGSATFDFLTSVTPQFAAHEYPVTRVHNAAVYPPGGTGHVPMERLNRVDMAEYEGATPMTPLVWTAEGQTLRIAPVPSEPMALRLRVLVSERADLNDADELLMPERYHNIVIDLARAYIFEMKADDDRAKYARDRAEASLRRALANSRPFGGPGSTPLGG